MSEVSEGKNVEVYIANDEVDSGVTGKIGSSIAQLSHITRQPVFGVSGRSDTNPAEQAQKMARGLKFPIN